MKMKKLHILCIAVLTAGVALAGLFDPDYRGDENSVHAVFRNPFAGSGLAVTLDVVEYNFGPSFYPVAPLAPSGFYDGITTLIQGPNFIDDLPLMKARVQLEFLSPAFFDDIYGNLLTPATWSIVESSDPLAVSTHHWIDIEIIPSLDFADIEFINLAEPVFNAPYIIEIDTVSIPEPASIGLLGLVTGGIFFTRRIFAI
jgi:hypothetical protein